MSSTNTLIKWPGGKTREIKYIQNLIPEYDRYIEPFFGGGAMFFFLKPQKAVINDISKNLIDFYTLVKEQNPLLKRYLLDYCTLMDSVLKACDTSIEKLLRIYGALKEDTGLDSDGSVLKNFIRGVTETLPLAVTEDLIQDTREYEEILYDNVLDKMRRTVKNEMNAPFSETDLRENLITGFTSGTYMYFRNIYNDILLERTDIYNREYRVANFYFIREYCYGSMFRYNSNGEFNIPYGGMSYNRKNIRTKIDEIFSSATKKQFSSTEIFCDDFESFFAAQDLTEKDFVFLDPPYDTEFSEYEGLSFTQDDQQRLANVLKRTKAKFILVIKNTDFIYSLYKEDFTILSFEKTYTYNIRSRNDRYAEHLIITNIPA